MKKFAANLFLFGGLFILLAVVLPCTHVRAADKPEYWIVDKTWDSITISVTFTLDSEYNMVSLSSPYDLSESSDSDIMFSKGTYRYTFKNLKNPGSLYFITIYYGDNQFFKFSTRTVGIPQGKHVRIDLDFAKYIKNNISYDNLVRWIDHLDAAYDSYFNLVGAKPQNGDTINIVSSDEDIGYMWVYPNTSTIYWHEDYIADGLRQINRYDDWHFGTLHEIGHLFDLDDIWTFDSEFFANFKMAYVFYERDGDFRVMIDGKIVTRYSDIVDFYYSGSEGSYIKTIGADKMTYSNDGLTYMFLNGIKEFGSWYSIKGAFNYFNDVGKQSNAPVPIDSFLSIVSYFTPHSNQFSYAFSKYYGNQYQFVKLYLDKMAGLRKRSNVIVD